MRAARHAIEKIDAAFVAHLMDVREEIARFVRKGTGPMGGTRIVQAKPVITVSQGYTYAGGLELFCHGHIRLAEPQATFSVACRRWGVPLVDGGVLHPHFSNKGNQITWAQRYSAGGSPSSSKVHICALCTPNRSIWSAIRWRGSPRGPNGASEWLEEAHIQ